VGVQSLNREEFLALLKAAKAKRERDYVMILVGFCHGLRASEVIALTAKNFSDGNLMVQRLKGSLKTVQPLIAHSEPLLNERVAVLAFLRGKRRNQRLFPVTRQRFWQIVQEHGATAAIAQHKRHPHVLKHSIAMQTIHSAGIHNVRQHLGHKSLSSTGEYLKVSDSEASAAVSASLQSF
jgi:integrase/recombinase XerD